MDDTPETEEPAYGNPGSLAIIVLSVIIPGLVLLASIIALIFLCYYRDRIPIFRSRAQKYASPAAKTQTPHQRQGDAAYPTQPMAPPAGEETGVLMEEGGVSPYKDEDRKSEPLEMVVAVDTKDTSTV